MTTAVRPYRSGLETRRDGFGQLLRAELTKFRTVRGWVIGMLVAALVIVLLGLITASANRGPGAASPPAGPGGEAVTDSFYFVHQPLAGDGSLTVRVTGLTGLIPPDGRIPVGQGRSDMRSGLEPWSKAGMIIKESTRPGSAYAAMMVTGSHGVRMQYDYTSDTAGLPGVVSGASPRWLRLTRSGDTLTGYDSADGTHWAKVGTATLGALPATVQAGLFTASPDSIRVLSQNLGGGSTSPAPSMATAAFDNVGRSGTWPGGTWTGGYVGAADASGIGGYQQASGRFTVTGSGDIAPAVAGPGHSGKPIETTVVGAFAGLIAVIVVGAMFMTAEYRRGLIRITFAASPRRGRVLAAKAIVIGAVTFAAGVAAAAVAVPLGERIARGNGNFVFPVTPLTELRVVTGTAALLAVAAVFALAVATMLRRSAGAVTAVIAAIVLVYILATASVLPAGPSEWLLRFTPAAGFAIQQSMPQYAQVSASYTPSDGYFPLAPWAGFAVLCGYAAVVLGLAVMLLRRRDA